MSARDISRDISLGVDVGGTNTDAVALDGSGRVVAHAKRPTTEDVTGGIRASIASVLAGLGDLGVERSRVSRVMLGTTHATNAIVRRRELDRVAVIRLGAPATTEYPPLTGWPDDLVDVVRAGSTMTGGGHMVDGTPISPLDPDAIRRFLDDLGDGFDAVAVTGVFSPSTPEQELEVADLVAAHLGDEVRLFLSHDIGPTGLLERENATVLNAALHGVARRVTDALVTVVGDEGLDATAYFAQNDGTLMSIEHAATFPVLTIGSGPANSIRGAAYLSGTQDAIVVDVGGTTADLGVVVNGFPRESTLPREIGGVRTNFRMPDVVSIGVGGGTVVHADGTIGPDSVGFRIAQEGLVFGGSTPTLTDAAVLAGRELGDRRLPPLDAATSGALKSGLGLAHARIEEAVELLSLGRTELPLVVVGGGGFLVPDGLAGAGEVLRPGHADVANAVGAAISLAGGRAESLARLADRAEALEETTRNAVERAIAAGADPREVEVVDVLEVPVTYSAEPTVRMSVKAAGPLARIEHEERP